MTVTSSQWGRGKWAGHVSSSAGCLSSSGCRGSTFHTIYCETVTFVGFKQHRSRTCLLTNHPSGDLHFHSRYSVRGPLHLPSPASVLSHSHPPSLSRKWGAHRVLSTPLNPPWCYWLSCALPTLSLSVNDNTSCPVPPAQFVIVAPVSI